jgi:hypothetical protein
MQGYAKLIVLRVIITLSDYFTGRESLMGFEELVDTLIAEGHKTISLVSNMRHTDDERFIIEEYLVLDASGDIVARKIRIPEGYGWSMVDWPGYRPGDEAQVVFGGVELNDADTAKGYFLLLAYD